MRRTRKGLTHTKGSPKTNQLGKDQEAKVSVKTVRYCGVKG